MSDAFFVARSGVSYTHSEFRRHDGAFIETEGVMWGLDLQVGTGKVTATPGAAAIRDTQPQRGYYIAPIDVLTDVTVDAQASGTRIDTFYCAVNDSDATITATGVAGAIGIGQAYVARVTSPTPIPAGSVPLGQVMVKGSVITKIVTGMRLVAELSMVAGRYVHNDRASFLWPGTTAETPIGPTSVANKQYVDDKSKRSRNVSWQWGSSAGYGPVFLNGGGAELVPGSEHVVSVIKDHLYQFTSKFTLVPNVLGAATARGFLWIDGAPVSDEYFFFTSGNSNPGAFTVAPATLQQVWRATATKDITISTRFATSVGGGWKIENPFSSPYSVWSDLGADG